MVNIIFNYFKIILAYEKNAGIGELKKLVTKISSNGWDQNKTWMQCLDKIMNTLRK
jgi:hypothetical protein